MSGPRNCTHSGYPQASSATTAAEPTPVTVPLMRLGTICGWLAASTATMITAATTVWASISSEMNTWAATSRPSETPSRTA